MTCMYDSWKHYGSTLHCAKGLYLDPENFSKELVLNFNLGPLKDLDGLMDEVLASREKPHQSEVVDEKRLKKFKREVKKWILEGGVPF